MVALNYSAEKKVKIFLPHLQILKINFSEKVMWNDFLRKVFDSNILKNCALKRRRISNIPFAIVQKYITFSKISFENFSYFTKDLL